MRLIRPIKPGVSPSGTLLILLAMSAQPAPGEQISCGPHYAEVLQEVDWALKLAALKDNCLASITSLEGLTELNM